MWNYQLLRFSLTPINFLEIVYMYEYFWRQNYELKIDNSNFFTYYISCIVNAGELYAHLMNWIWQQSQHNWEDKLHAPAKVKTWEYLFRLLFVSVCLFDPFSHPFLSDPFRQTLKTSVLPSMLSFLDQDNAHLLRTIGQPQTDLLLLTHIRSRICLVEEHEYSSLLFRESGNRIL